MSLIAEIFRRSPQFDEWCDAAKPQTALWRLLVGLLIIIAGLVVLVLAASALLTLIAPRAAAEFMLQTMNTPGGTFFALSTFLLWPPAIWLGLKLMHKAPLRSLLSNFHHLDLKHYFVGLGLAFSIALLSIFGAGLIFGMPIRNPINFETWGIYLLIAVPLLAVQTGAEELLFRGYLQRYLGARFSNAFFWAIIPTALFGALHWNPEGYQDDALMIVFTTGLFGFVLAITVAQTGKLSLAMGLHMGVNMAAILLVSPPDYLSGLALYSWPKDPNLLKNLILIDITLIVTVGILALWWAKHRAAKNVA
ncbi:MAG: lysostaphin resistance A-like protein [Pikeienuella sp.]